MKNRWSPGKIAAVICGSIAGGVVLLILLFFGIFFSVKGVLKIFMNTEIPEEIRQEVQEKMHGNHEADPGEDTAPYFEEDEKEAPEEDSGYYDFHDAIRSDLSYQIRIEEYTGQAHDNGHATSKITYPVVEGEDKAKTTAANKAIQAELHAVEDYLNTVSENLESEDELEFNGECYVTYMDEQTLSVVYWEEGWLNGTWQEACLISVNIDMESGIPLTNSQILEMDEKFAIEFRERSEKQNGEDEYLNLYSDQEITELLNSDDSLIIFYTPLGMEVGVNHYGGWVTVTYRDYEKYLKKF